MNLLLLVFHYLKAKPLNTVLNIFLLSLGIAVITTLLLFSNQLEQKITKNSKGIDLVVGAKGSPLQLILCNIFHVDFPTGNIKLSEADKLARHRLIKKAIPLALGDSYQNFRIIGTNRDYADLYGANLSVGEWWSEDLEVTVGVNVAELLKFKVGDTFFSTHGLGSGGHVHEKNRFTVKGILKRSGTVLDNLILTNVESIWRVHEEHEDESEDEHEHHEINRELKPPINPSVLVPTIETNDTTRQITSLLLQYRNPIAAIQLPRQINSQSNLQAASPAFETARLFSILGVGVEVLMGFAYALIAISALSIFIALYNSLKERQYDLVIMRAMGASRVKLFMSVLLEGMAMTLSGSILGLAFGHLILLTLSHLTEEGQLMGMSDLVFSDKEWLIFAGSLVLGILCSLLPSIKTYRTDIHKVLSEVR